MPRSIDGEARLRVLGRYEGHTQPGSLEVMAISDDASVAAIAAGTGLEVIDLRTGTLAFSTAKGKVLLAGLCTSGDGRVLAGFANLAEKTRRLVIYTRGPKGYRGTRLALPLSTGPATLAGEANLALTADGSHAVTVEGRANAEAVVIDTASGDVIARIALGARAARGGPTPSGAWRLTRDRRLWTVHPVEGGSELVCRSLDDGRVLGTWRHNSLLVIEDESPGGRLALLAPRSAWAHREPIADAIVLDREGHQLLRTAARDGALRFDGDDALVCLPARPHLASFRTAPEEALRLDLRGGPPLVMPGAAAVARLTTAAQAVCAVFGDTLLVSDGSTLWELTPGGAVRAAHPLNAHSPARLVHLAVRGDRVVLVADHDGAIRTKPSPTPTTVVTVLAASRPGYSINGAR